MGIYDSNMSCWQRRKAGLAQDHAGQGVIGEIKPTVVEEVAEVIIQEQPKEVVETTGEEEPQAKVEAPVEGTIEGEKQEESETAGKIIPKKGKNKKDPS